jgi:hypothetical protein
MDCGSSTDEFGNTVVNEPDIEIPATIQTSNGYEDVSELNGMLFLLCILTI